MSSWVENFEKHAVWKTLEEVRAKLEEYELPVEEGDRDTVEYVTSVVERIGTYRKDADPVAFTVGMLEEVNGALRNLVNEYSDWRAGGPTENTSVDTATADVVDVLAKWPSLSPKQTEAAAKKAATALSAATTEALDAVATKRNEMDAALVALQARADELAQQLEAVQNETGGQLASSQQSWADAMDAKKAEADATIDELKDLRQQALNMVHETTAATVGAEYVTYSAEKQTLAQRYDIAAALFGVLGLASLGVYLFEHGQTDTSFSLALTRLGITVGALVIGGLLATRGNDQHKEAKAARRTALALSRIGPFVANLPKDARDVLTIETADRIFTKGELSDVSERDSVLTKLEELRDKRRAEEDEEEA